MLSPFVIPPSLPWQKRAGPLQRSAQTACKPAVSSTLRSHGHRTTRCKAQERESSAVGEGELLQSSRILESNGHVDCREGERESPESLSHPPSAHPAGQAIPHISSVVSGVSWQQWLAHFEQADAATKRMEELAMSLKESVREEQYRQAAAVKAEMTALDEQDAVASVQKQLQAALAEERYGDAASLSQSGLTGLQGWWAGQAEDDPVGHLLHIKQEYSRWTGRVFRPRDLAAMKVNKPSGSSHMPGRSSVPQAKPLGSPIFEVFVRSKEDEAGATQYLHQSVSLQLPSLEEARTTSRSKARAPPARQSEHGSGTAPDALSTGPAVRLRISVHDDGMLHIQPLSVQQPQQHSSSSSDSNASRSGDMSSSSSSSVSRSGSEGPDLGSDEVVDIASQNAMSSLEENEESSVTIVSETSDSSSARGIGIGRYHSSNVQEEMSAELARLPASIELLSHDRLVYHVPDYQAGSAQERLAGLPTSESGRGAVAASSALEEEAPHFEVIVPMAHVSSTSSSGSEAAVADAVPMEALSVLADQVAQSLEAKTGCAASREQIAQAMQDVLQRVAAGEPMSSIDIYVSGQQPATAQDAASSPAAAADDHVTSFFYKRIAAQQVRTDPLSGLYLGSFGPHGPELLQLSRSVVDGEEMVQATKLTGDANVPAGLVSFRAKVARKHRMDGRDVYPDELGIMARYKGEGRVAQKGFSQPKWVDGELLVFNAKGNALTAGAELGFVWAVPGEKRFLILLNRVDLS